MATSVIPEQRLTLRDGREGCIRPIRSDDAERLREGMRLLSENTRRLRFFSPLRELSEGFAWRLANVDFADRVALVVTLAGDEAVRGVGRYDRDGPASAELAFVIADELQGNGIATLMLQLLAQVARQHGIFTFTGLVLAENVGMLAVFRESGYPMRVKPEHETVRVFLDLGHEAPGRGDGPA